VLQILMAKIRDSVASATAAHVEPNERGGPHPAAPPHTPVLSVVSNWPTGHAECEDCYRDHRGHRRGEHQIGHVNGGQNFDHG
jgi:hypothetical protein